MTRGVPVRTILATIGLVLATFVGLLMVRELARIIAWLVVATFLAVLATPVVDFLQHRAKFRRGLSHAHGLLPRNPADRRNALHLRSPVGQPGFDLR